MRNCSSRLSSSVISRFIRIFLPVMMLRGASSSVLESSDDSFPSLFRSLDRRLCLCVDFRFSPLLDRLLRCRALSSLEELEERELLLELDEEDDDDDEDVDSLSLSSDEDSPPRLSLLRLRLCFLLWSFFDDFLGLFLRSFFFAGRFFLCVFLFDPRISRDSSRGSFKENVVNDRQGTCKCHDRSRRVILPFYWGDLLHAHQKVVLLPSV